jgi:hypothetical protein
MYPTEKLAEIAAARQTRLAVKANPAVRRKWTKYQIALGKALDCRTHFNDLTNELVSHNGSAVHFFALVVWMQIGTANSRRAHPNDNVRGLLNPGIGSV